MPLALSKLASTAAANKIAWPSIISCMLHSTMDGHLLLMVARWKISRTTSTVEFSAMARLSNHACSLNMMVGGAHLRRFSNVRMRAKELKNRSTTRGRNSSMPMSFQVFTHSERIVCSFTSSSRLPAKLLSPSTADAKDFAVRSLPTRNPGLFLSCVRSKINLSEFIWAKLFLAAWNACRAFTIVSLATLSLVLRFLSAGPTSSTSTPPANAARLVLRSSMPGSRTAGASPAASDLPSSSADWPAGSSPPPPAPLPPPAAASRAPAAPS